MQRNRRPAHHVGPHSRPHRLIKLDGRTKEAALMRSLRKELTQHVGGNPSAVARALIERCCWLQLRISLLDRKIASGRDLTEIDSNTYLAWQNSLVRTLARLGLDPAKSNNSSSSPFNAVLEELGRNAPR